MKLQHLAIGARFEYEGAIYVKTGPLTAASEEGGQRIIPRYAVLKPLEQPAEESKSPARGRLEAQRVRAAFDRFFDTCTQLVGEDGQETLLKAKADFLEAIK